MNQNPQKIMFFKEYCKKHPSNVLEYICDRQKCDYYLSFECFQCRQEHSSEHSHQCPKVKSFVRKLHEEIIVKLTKEIKKSISVFEKYLISEIHELRNNLQSWYSPLDETTTEKQFVHTVENPSKWAKIQEINQIKNSLIEHRLKEFSNRYKRQMEDICKFINTEMEELKYRIAPLDWKFDRNYSHELVNISGVKDRTIDKKSQKEKYCVAIVNQPITPLRNEITFTINSQNQYDQLILIGLCDKRQIIKDHFETDLKKGVYAIYQAAKAGSRNNALSLHSADGSMHYKQAGWNFRSGDSITISLFLLQGGSLRILFRKKKQKEQFELFIEKSHAFLHPFVALFASGDKVSIDCN